MAHKVMARVNALTLGGVGEKSLAAMEKHGKRRDHSSRARQVSRRRPIVHGTLDLRAAYDRHVDGARSNAALNKPVLHMLMKFPDACLSDGPDTPAPYRGLSERDRKKLMMEQAVAFADRCYGGNAVFAGRVDRDESGELNVDVFMTPRYVKRTKTGKESEWISTTKHGKELAEKHGDAIRRRMKKGDDLTGPRAVGIALQEELRLFHLEVNGIETVREPKIGRRPDRRAIEDWQATRDAEAAAVVARLEAAEAAVAAADAAADQIMADMDAEAARTEAAELRRVAIEAAEFDAAAIRAAAARDAAAVRDRTKAIEAEAEKVRAAAQADADAAAKTKKDAEAEAVAIRAAAATDAAAAAQAKREAEAARRAEKTAQGIATAAAEAAEKIRDNVAAIRAAAVLDVEATKAAKAAAEADAAASRADRDAAGKELAAAATIRQRLERIFGRVVGWLRGDTLPPAIRAEARALAKEAGVPDLPRPRIDELAATPPTTKKENVRPGLDF
jgi:hypothetical protein